MKRYCGSGAAALLLAAHASAQTGSSLSAEIDRVCTRSHARNRELHQHPRAGIAAEVVALRTLMPSRAARK